MQPDGTIAFLEMNRRLQVEHPVTECCFGIDLVAWQLRVAAGEKLPPQDVFVSRGHAIEARLYAEDPTMGFMPSVGDVLLARLPEGPGLRVDGALETGMAVTPHFDPMLAKVIAHGETRAEAIARLDRALGDTVVIGVKHNIAFLRRLLRDALFEDPINLRIDGIDREGERLCDAPNASDLVMVAAATARSRSRSVAQSGAAVVAAPSPWDVLTDFRVGESS